MTLASRLGALGGVAAPAGDLVDLVCAKFRVVASSMMVLVVVAAGAARAGVRESVAFVMMILLLVYRNSGIRVERASES